MRRTQPEYPRQDESKLYHGCTQLHGPNRDRIPDPLPGQPQTNFVLSEPGARIKHREGPPARGVSD